MKSVLFKLFFHYFLDSILMVPLNFNNQKHLQLIDFILKKLFFLSRNTAHLHFSPK